MDIDPQLLKMLLETFQAELDDQLQAITEGLLQLEKPLEDERRQDVLNSVFRSAHNIKGAARGVDVAVVASIAHHLESLFSAFKQANRRPRSDTIDLCLEALDRIRDAMQSHAAQTEPEFDVEALCARLDQATEAGDAATLPPAATAAAIEVQPDTESSAEEIPAEHEADDAAQALQSVTEVQPPVSEEQGCPASEPQPQSKPARSVDKQAQEKAATAAPQSVQASEVVRVTTDKLDQVAALAEELQVAKIGLEDHYEGVQAMRLEIDQLNGFWRRSSSILKRSEEMSLPEELRQLLSASGKLAEQLQGRLVRLQKSMRSTTSRMGFLSTALQNDMRMLRLVPAATLLRPLTRSVRDIARELNKQIELHVEGDEIELDRAVLDGVRDPMMHLLRNAIDHGIEVPEERAAADKPEQGSIRISVSSEGGQILFSLRDDGRGVDAEAIAEAAVRKRLLRSEEVSALSAEEKVDLIFRPGFSSKEIITEVSGRGVGLDVVRANLRELKGSVSLETEVGKGTCFRLRVPLTLTTERGLQVRAGGEEFIIPSISVERILEIEGADVVNVEASQAILLDGRPIPLRDLASTLELSGDERKADELLSVVIVSKGWRAVALLVDEVVGEREIVIKRLLPPLHSVRNVTGATLTGSGGIMMVLSAGDLVDTALGIGSTAPVSTASVDVQETHAPRILVVDDSITTRTLERTILETHGYEVEVATDGREGWNMVQQQAFDLVVTDIEMPIMNGFELAGHIKESERYAGIPVVIVSSLAKEEDKRRGIEVGADAYIVKGQFETQALLDVVKQLV